MRIVRTGDHLPSVGERACHATRVRMRLVVGRHHQPRRHLGMVRRRVQIVMSKRLPRSHRGDSRCPTCELRTHGVTGEGASRWQSVRSGQPKSGRRDRSARWLSERKAKPTRTTSKQAHINPSAMAADFFSLTAGDGLRRFCLDSGDRQTGFAVGNAWLRHTTLQVDLVAELQPTYSRSCLLHP
jgi:hypothetical protein